MAFAIGIAFLATAAQATEQRPAVTVSVDVSTGRHPISPNIYGVTGATTAQLADLNIPLNRNGGDTASTYNWQLNASNHGIDQFFESIAEPSATAGELIDTFIANTRAGHAEPMVTIPMLDWIAKLASGRATLASFSQAKYGAQTGSDPSLPDAGNGVLTSTGQDMAGNDPNDANRASSVAFQKTFVHHLVTLWLSAAKGGQKDYVLDNEPSLWHVTHRDVHPVGATMDEMRQKMIDYATMIRSMNSKATLFGPEEWGWGGYLYSGSDQQYSAAHPGTYPDRAAHSNMDYIPWLLDQLHQYDVANGTRMLDVLSVHYFPQGGEYSDDVSATMQRLRARSTRSLWDPNYVDASWINAKVMLIPRMKNWVARYYPGLKTGITAYNWGAEGNINGATTQADILGIFGREGLDYATRSSTPPTGSDTYIAMKMFRNPDGFNNGFGDIAVSMTPVPHADEMSIFPAVRSSDGALTVMVVSKVLALNTPLTIHVANFPPADYAYKYRLTSTQFSSGGGTGWDGIGTISDLVPPLSVSLYVLQIHKPSPKVSATPLGGLVPLQVQFSSAGSTDSKGTIVSYAWDFGDGGTSTDPNPVHTYTTAGNINAFLTLTNNFGGTSRSGVTIDASDGTGPINQPSCTGAMLNGNAIDVTWHDSSYNEEGFQVLRSVYPGSSYHQVGQVGPNITTYHDANVPSGSWKYKVKAFNNTNTAICPGPTKAVTVP